MDRLHVGIAVAAAGLLAAGCTTSTEPSAGPEPAVRALDSPAPTPSPTRDNAATNEAAASPTTTPEPAAEVNRSSLLDVVDGLAAGLGPREATSRAFARAARLMERRLSDLGYDVTTQPVPVPAGTSWGVDVPAGESVNVVAVAPGTNLAEPHIVVGAHLDTVPQAPGGVDNASGVSAVLEVARLAMVDPPPQPVVFVAFGAEEPRGLGDDLHHFGSQAYVAAMPPNQRAALIGAIAIDSVGISRTGVPVCSADEAPDPFTQAVRQALRQADVPLRPCTNRTSDHWSFVRNGLDGTRIGLAGTDEYAEYHSGADVADVVRGRPLVQAAEGVWAAISRPW
ncbi:MAG: M28 family peptidase [Jiangellales bacterium]